MDFPKLLNELFASSFSLSAVSGGFRRAGVWPLNDEAMKEKVVRRHSSNNNSTTNNSSAMDLLSSLLDEIQTPDVDVNINRDLSASGRIDVDSPPSSSYRQRTFDDSDSDESIVTGPPKNKKSTYNDTSDEESDGNSTSSSNQHFTNSIGTTSLTPAQMSPSSAARSIMLSYSKDKNASSSSAPVKPNSRIRGERKFGEVITNGNLLDELKQKAEAKKAKELKQNGASRSQRSSKK